MFLEMYNNGANFNKCIIGNVYRRPSELVDDLTQFIKEFSITLSNIHAISKQAYRWSPAKNTYIQICNCSGNEKN